MRLRKEDEFKDYQFGHGSADYWHDSVEGVAQNIETRMMLFRGEWFLDVQEGTPWGGFPLNEQVIAQGQILGAHTQLTRDVAIQQRVLGTGGVSGISDYFSYFDPVTRGFSATMTVETIYGKATLSLQAATNDVPGFVLNWSGLGGSDPLAPRMG